MHIVGTAGHVDHGKSSLVQALTGTNPDRWLEERARGMTLDLGFAHLRYDDGIEAGIVDVPGHERFLHNMLAGAAGMELVLLVIAADDGVMPQTLEHLQILRYLNVKRTVVAITKCDLLTSDAFGESFERIRYELRDTIAAKGPFIAVDSITGFGLDVLRRALHDALSALPLRDALAPVYMPIDRVFTLPGRGTIVTGTLMQGRIAAGESVAIAPLGLNARVRGIQIFGAPHESASAGSRVALNLPGIERSAIARGATVADPAFAARSEYAVRFEPLPEAEPLLRRRTPVRAYIGSAEILGTLVRDAETRLVLREPVLAFPGVRFVLRRVSPKTLLGGGEIIALGARRGEESPAVSAVGAFLASSALQPQDVPSIAFATNLRAEAVNAELEELLARGEVIAVARPAAYVAAGAFAQFGTRVNAELAALHEREPWAMGVTSLLLARTLGIDETVLLRLLAALVDEGRIAQRHGYYAATDHQPRLSVEQRAFFEDGVTYDAAQPFRPVSFEDVAARVKQSPIPGLRRAFDTLLVRGVLVKVGDALYRGTQIDGVRERVEAFIVQHGEMTPAQFRDLLGTSRKYAMPLLEWLDTHGITVRNGDARRLRVRSRA